MSKTSISRIQNDNAVDALPFSPLVWTTKGFVILTDDVYNLKKIQLSLYKVCADFAENNREIEAIELETANLKVLVSDLTKNQNQLILVASELQNRIFPALQTLSGLGTSLSITNARLQKDLVTIDDIFSVVDTIRNGQLLQVVGKDVQVLVDNSSYKISTKLTNGLLESGDGIVDVVYDPIINSYEISAGVIRDSNITTSTGLAITVAADKKFATLSITRDFLAVSTDQNYSGLELSYSTDSVFSLKPKANFIKVSPDSGLILTKTLSGIFELDLSPSLLSTSQQKYESGYGINIIGKTLSVDTSVLPKFVSGSTSIVINKLSVNPDIFEINFDPGLEDWPDDMFKKMVVEVSAPLILQYEPSEHTYKIGVDKSSNLWNGNSFETNENLNAMQERALQLTNSRMVKQLSSSFRQTYTNPLFRMFCLLTGDYENSGIVGSVDPYKLTLVQRFGTKPVLINVNTDVVPYIFSTSLGGIMGTDLEVDLFAVLEAKLKVELNDEDFVILEEQKNTLYSFVEVQTNSVSATNISEYGQKPQLLMTYNSAYTLDGLEYYATSQFIRETIGFTADCSNVVTLDNFKSTKHKNLKLAVTGGDVDFILGNPLQNQKNAVPLVFPTNLLQVDKIKLKNVIKTFDKDTQETTFVMTIYDGYTAATYMSTFRSTKIIIDNDYISEISGEKHPGQVRAFARLYANNQQSDLDINRIIYFLGKSNKCYAKFLSLYIHEGVLKQKLHTRDISDTYNAPKYSQHTSVDYEKGTLKIAAVPAEDYDLINVATTNIIGQIKIRAQFRIAGFSDFSSPQNLMNMSCWNCDVADCTDTGVLPQLPFDNPEDLFE